MKTKNLLIALITVLSLTACIQERKINIDERLLQPVINNSDLQISYRVPVGCEMIDQNYVDSIANLQLNEFPFDPELLKVYVDTVLNANILVSDMTHVPFEKTENTLDFYKIQFNPQNVWDTVELERFKLNDFEKIVELTMQNKEKTLKKVLFYDKDPKGGGELKAKFSIDYFYPTKFATDFQHYYESSIASVNNSYEIVIDGLE